MYGNPVRTHDLVRLRAPSSFTADTPVPPWVQASLRRIPWVVVRRGRIGEGLIPVGVRGATRTERFAGFVSLNDVAARQSPEDLSVWPTANAPDRLKSVPALSALGRVSPVLAGRDEGWGPGGSVGFEIATGVPTATPSSDLDLVIRQERRLEPDQAVALLIALVRAASPTRIDAMLETSRGGVSLADLASTPARVLLRTPSGAELCTDPWRVDAAPREDRS
jgi:phosphoribosyl-dephospho-CoA transferase